MGDTSLTIPEQTKDRLSRYRHPDHDSWSETLHDLMDVIPTVDDTKEDCSNPDCENEHLSPDETLKHRGGVLRFFTVHGHDYPDLEEDTEYFSSNYYCSLECATHVEERNKAYLPENPDRVVVGGKDEMRVELTDTSFYKDGHSTEVGINIPGAFAGQSSHEYEYDYFGEPVYVQNEGMWIQKGIIDDIIHEETHTALILGHDHAIESEYHPDTDE